MVYIGFSVAFLVLKKGKSDFIRGMRYIALSCNNYAAAFFQHVINPLHGKLHEYRFCFLFPSKIYQNFVPGFENNKLAYILMKTIGVDFFI